MKKNARIPVAFICDDNYALPTAVAITSMGLSRHRETCYDVSVIGTDLSDDSEKRLLSLNGEGLSVTLIKKSFSEEQARVVQVRKRVTPSALFKFDLPNIFPETDKLLYLDSDVLIQKDLSALYGIELGETYAGVVSDAITLWGRPHREALRMQWNTYFNSGMMLMNLKKMREDMIPEKLLDYRINGRNYFMDQDALNVVFAGNIRLVPPEYNLLPCFFSWYDIAQMQMLYHVEFPKCVEDIYQNAAVLHFGDEKKPWLHDMGEYLNGLYQSIYRYSPYADKALTPADDRAKHEENETGGAV